MESSSPIPEELLSLPTELMNDVRQDIHFSENPEIHPEIRSTFLSESVQKYLELGRSIPGIIMDNSSSYNMEFPYFNESVKKDAQVRTIPFYLRCPTLISTAMSKAIPAFSRILRHAVKVNYKNEGTFSL